MYSPVQAGSWIVLRCEGEKVRRRQLTSACSKDVWNCRKTAIIVGLANRGDRQYIERTSESIRNETSNRPAAVTCLDSREIASCLVRFLGQRIYQSVESAADVWGDTTPRKVHFVGRGVGVMTSDTVRRRLLRSGSLWRLLAVVLTLATLPSCDSKCLPCPRCVTEEDIEDISMLLRLYYDNHGELPKGSSGAIMQAVCPCKCRHHDVEGNRLDGWGCAIQISITEQGKRFSIRSAGSDRKDDNGQGDDLDVVYVLDEVSGVWKKERCNYEGAHPH